MFHPLYFLPQLQPAVFFLYCLHIGTFHLFVVLGVFSSAPASYYGLHRGRNDLESILFLHHSHFAYKQWLRNDVVGWFV